MVFNSELICITGWRASRLCCSDFFYFNNLMKVLFFPLKREIYYKTLKTEDVVLQLTKIKCGFRPSTLFGSSAEAQKTFNRIYKPQR